MNQTEAQARCDKIEFLADVIELYYTRHATGGSLHNVLDDGNLDDNSVSWCLEHAQENGDHEGEAIAKRLLELSENEREAMYESQYVHNGVSAGWGSYLAVELIQKQFEMDSERSEKDAEMFIESLVHRNREALRGLARDD